MGGAASKSRLAAQAVPKRGPHVQASAESRAPDSGASREPRTSGDSFVAREQQDVSSAAGGATGRSRHLEDMRQGKAQFEDTKRSEANHQEPGEERSAGTADTEHEGEEAADTDLLKRLQNLVVESKETDAKRPPIPLRVPLKGSRSRQFAEDSIDLPKGYSTYKHIMVTLFMHQKKAKGFTTPEEIAERLEISVDDARALVKHYGIFGETFLEPSSYQDVRAHEAPTPLRGQLQPPPLVKPDP